MGTHDRRKGAKLQPPEEQFRFFSMPIGVGDVLFLYKATDIVAPCSSQQPHAMRRSARDSETGNNAPKETKTQKSSDVGPTNRQTVLESSSAH